MSLGIDKLRKRSEPIISQNCQTEKSFTDTNNPIRLRFEVDSIEEFTTNAEKHQQESPLFSPKSKADEFLVSRTLSATQSTENTFNRFYKSEQPTHKINMKGKDHRNQRISSFVPGEQRKPGVLSEYYEK